MVGLPNIIWAYLGPQPHTLLSPPRAVFWYFHRGMCPTSEYRELLMFCKGGQKDRSPVGTSVPKTGKRARRPGPFPLRSGTWLSFAFDLCEGKDDTKEPARTSLVGMRRKREFMLHMCVCDFCCMMVPSTMAGGPNRLLECSSSVFSRRKKRNWEKESFPERLLTSYLKCSIDVLSLFIFCLRYYPEWAECASPPQEFVAQT